MYKRQVKQCLAANHITELMGIFNGTTNFILTKMSQEGMEFGDALRLAQDMGYAEADPTELCIRDRDKVDVSLTKYRDSKLKFTF